MVIAEEDNRRFTVENLAASQEELTHFLALFFADNGPPDHRHGLCLHIPQRLANEVARCLAPHLVALTGGLMSYINTSVRTLYYDQKFWRGTETISNPQDHSKEVLAKLNHPTVLAALRQVRLSVALDNAEEQALIKFIREYKVTTEQQTTVDARYASSLSKKALIRRNSQGGWIPWSPLVFDILTYRLLQEPGHIACSFNVDSVIDLVTYIVTTLKSVYSDWVYPDENEKLKHEDEINSAIASILKNALGEDGVHRGPAKKTGKKTYSQVDHAIYWNSKDQPTLIETCLADVPGHINRFGATGKYKLNYNFGCGVVLVINKTVNPEPPNVPNGAIPTNTYLFHVSIPSYKLAQYFAAGKSWTPVGAE